MTRHHRLVRAAAAIITVAAVLVPSPGRAAVGRAAGAPAAPPTLDEWWSGAADWAPFRFFAASAFAPGDAGFGAGSHITIGPDGSWWWFTRRGGVAGTCAGDAATPAPGTVVRRSADQGATWSVPAAVVMPQAGTPWSCGATDGDAYFDGTRWHYVFQCLGQPVYPWKGCHLQNGNADPRIGPWTSPGANPIFDDAALNLWSGICGADRPNADCVRIPGGPDRLYGAGTFAIFDDPAMPGWHYLSFHGVDRSYGYQYRGLARTQDFVSYVVRGADLPADAFFDRLDTLAWREPDALWAQGALTSAGESVGGGSGNTVRQGGRWYTVTESSNAPVCTTATVMDAAIVRSSSLTSTAWEQPALPDRQNPVLYSDSLGATDLTPVRCSPSYERLFTAGGVTYLSAYRRSNDAQQGVWVYRLERNLLANGRANRCVDQAPWTSPTAVQVLRDGARSSDGGCAFRFSQWMSQTVARPAGVDTVTWGGDFSSAVLVGPLTLAGSAPVAVSLIQTDATGARLAADTQVVYTSGTGYTTATRVTALAAGAVALTFTAAAFDPGTPILSDGLRIVAG